jgi:cysteine desulfurase
VLECPVDADGRADVAALRSMVDERTAFVSVQLANNELGTIQPIDRIADIAHGAGALIHCDAAQAIGKVPVDIGVLDVDIVTFSGGKFYGPKGTGAIVGRAELLEQLPARTIGGGQEGGVRSGTHDVPGIVGLGEAARITNVELEVELRRIARLRTQLELQLRRALPGSRIAGVTAPRVPGICSLVLPDDLSGSLVLALARDIAASTGSACSSGGPSHVLRAIGMNDREAGRVMRLSLGRFTDAHHVLRAVSSITSAAAQLRRRAARTTGVSRAVSLAGLQR